MAFDVFALGCDNEVFASVGGWTGSALVSASVCCDGVEDELSVGLMFFSSQPLALQIVRKVPGDGATGAPWDDGSLGKM